MSNKIFALTVFCLMGLAFIWGALFQANYINQYHEHHKQQNTEKMDKYTPNGSKDDLKLGILHEVNGYWVSNEGTAKKPNYHVWIPGLTHSTCDSAYSDISLAVARCNYLAKR